MGSTGRARPSDVDPSEASPPGGPVTPAGVSRATHRGQDHEPPPWRVEGAPSGAGSAGPGTRRPPWKDPLTIALFAGLLALNLVLVGRTPEEHARLRVPYSFFRAQAEAGNVAEVNSRGDTIEGTFRRDVTYPPPADTNPATPPAPNPASPPAPNPASPPAPNPASPPAPNPATPPTSKAAAPTKGTVSHLFRTERPAFADDGLLGILLDKGAIVNARPLDSGRSLLATLVWGFGPTLLLVGLFMLMMRKTAAGMHGGLSSIGRSKARRYEADGQRTTFADVAGIDEATAELTEVVDFLRTPERYRALGGMIPKGVLLVGPPGTGKTLLARAVAGEANVPFFSLSASEFVEMIVGVGASRARDLFNQAKAAAPAIIFIDELDSIGRVRGAGGLSGANDEREQTLNQILTEMDGFTGSEGVIVLAATNRPEILDPALLRPGRFDRRVVVNPPDLRGRAAILAVHTRSVPLDADVTLDDLAAITPGMVGADLRNLVNEAALTAARRGRDRVGRADFTEALEKVVLGTARRIMLSPVERHRTAVHEAGHALLGMLQPGADPVRKVSIIPRGRALGVTMQTPAADRYGYTSAELKGRLVGMLGGRAAEQLVVGDVTTGAESDLEQATGLARHMVGRWGMSETLGPVSMLPAGADGLFFAGVDAPSERTRARVDDEVEELLEASARQASTVLAQHRAQLDALVEALLANETLDEADAYQAAGLPRPDRPSLANRAGDDGAAVETVSLSPAGGAGGVSG